MAISRYAEVNWPGGLTEGAGTIDYVSRARSRACP